MVDPFKHDVVVATSCGMLLIGWCAEFHADLARKCHLHGRRAAFRAPIFKVTSHGRNLHLYGSMAIKVLQFDQCGSNSTLGELQCLPLMRDES